MEITMAEELGIIDVHETVIDEWFKHPESITMGQYDQVMKVYGDKIREDYDRWYEPVSRFQKSFMYRVLDQYETDGDTARVGVYELIKYLVLDSETGNAIVNELTKEAALAINDQLFADFEDMILDSEVYENKNVYTDESEGWCVDVMFAGNYCPWWDGWLDD